MHFCLGRRSLLLVSLAALVVLFFAAPHAFAQGGEPQYFAVRGAKVFPVSGPPIENATIVIVRGVITAVGKDVAIPAEAWIIDGKGLTVYPGLFDAFTDVGIPAAEAPSPAAGGGGGRRAQTGERSNGPEDRPGSTAWRNAADEVSLPIVTRLKDNAAYGVVERRPVPQHGAVRRDEIIFLYKTARSGNYDLFLRRIEIWDETQQRTLVFLTNHRGFAASTIAAVYRQRWQIELLFKALKQNLRIKTFVGTSSNALQIQIWTALIALLVLKYLQLRARFGWSLSNLAALLRQQLFVYRDLIAWIDEPFQPPPLLDPGAEQLALSW